jgi:hypothetical protein
VDYSFGEDCLHDGGCSLPEVVRFGVIANDGGAVPEELSGVLSEQCEDGVFCLLT